MKIVGKLKTNSFIGRLKTMDNTFISRYLYTLDRKSTHNKPDQTLEIIMTELDPEKMKIFYREYTDTAAEATKVFSNCIRENFFDFIFDLLEIRYR